LGNLRTAVVAYLAAVAAGLDFKLRVEDLDARSRPDVAERQLEDLARLGLTWDGPVMWQSARTAAYEAAVADLAERGLVYPCFCSRREILDAPRAPHTPPGFYNGKCRGLTPDAVARLSQTRQPALRLASDHSLVTVHDGLAGAVTGRVDDFVLRRGDGAFAYNLAVVVDDSAQGVSQVVRGDDLLESAPRQAYLASLLGFEAPEYLHVPLVVNRDGRRLAKRAGDLTGRALWDRYGGTDGLLAAIGESLGLLAPGEAGGLTAMADRFDPAALPREPWVL
jgi:glutamyl-tRNA synthetase